MSKLIVGCGYVGIRLARFWQARNERVFVTSRNEQRLSEWADSGLLTLRLDVTDVRGVTLPEVDTVVFAVGFDRTGSQSIDEVYVEGLKNVLQLVGPSVRRFIYISSTGVYGQSSGEWIDETSACEPNRPGGLACLRAETVLRRHPTVGPRAIVLRLAGIYGPERLPQVQRLIEQASLEVAADAYLNLIHVDDVVRVIAAAAEDLPYPDLLCASDGSPVLRGDFYRYLAQLLQVGEPTFVPPPAQSSRAERARGSKRVCNRRLLEALPGCIQLTDYRVGLAAIVNQR